MPTDNDDTERTTVSWRVVSRTIVRTVICLLLIVMLYEAVGLYSMYRTHLRERQFMQRLEDRGARATYETVGPTWIPLSIRGRCTAFMHIGYVDLEGTQPTYEFLPELKTLHWLQHLSLARVPVHDADLKHLETMTGLQSLSLYDTRVTDAGLTHLYGLTHLTSLELAATQTTAEGRNRLRRQLPHCRVQPEP